MNKQELAQLNTSIQTRNIKDMTEQTGNLYKSLVIISKRANQIGAVTKEELIAKLEEFSSTTDNLEEIFENREQIEISKYYERLPKSTLIALEEFLQEKIYHRNPDEETESTDEA